MTVKKILPKTVGFTILALYLILSAVSCSTDNDVEVKNIANDIQTPIDTLQTPIDTIQTPIDTVKTHSEVGTLPGTGNPGHYITLIKSEATHADMTEISTHEGVIGIQKRWSWAELEPTENNYQLGEVLSDLDHAESLGLKLIIIIEDRSFTAANPNPIPQYMRDGFAAPNSGGGYTGARWKAHYRTRWNSLMTAMANEIGDKPALEGVAFQETSLGLGSNPTGIGTTYNVDDYAQYLKEMLLHASSQFHKTRVFWYMNFFSGNQSKIGQIASDLKATPNKNVLMGGPDILPNCNSLNDLAYPLYEEFKGDLTLFCSMQFASYEHPEEGNYCKPNPNTAPPYMSLEAMFNFGKNDLNLNYVFWNRKTWAGIQGSYTINDAYPIIQANATFNQ